MPKVKYCIITNKKEIIEYEKKFFQAYNEKKTNNWALNNMQIIDNCRLKPNIPYKDLIQLALKLNGEIIGGVKVNFNKDKFQLYEMGFNINRSEKNICEGLNLFFLNNKTELLDYINLIDDFCNYFIKKLKKKKVNIIYGTCDIKSKIIFLRIGFNIINQKLIEGETFFLLKKDIKNK